jgi:glutamine kinase
LKTPLNFLSKAQTLECLAGRLKAARVLPLMHFSVGEWQTDSKTILQNLKNEPSLKGQLIVRSSTLGEDSGSNSMAGHYRSVANVSGQKALGAAVNDVIASYADYPSPDNRVLVQPMLQDVCACGVAFSRDPNTGTDYIVINYEQGDDTAAVTGGRGLSLKTHYYWKHSPEAPKEELRDIVELVNELERLYGDRPLDIEFARDSGGRLYLFQVRPLVIRRTTGMTAPQQTNMLKQIAAKIDSSNRPHPYLHGRRTVYGVMPDWNPAEIIGIRPRPLALSLYREIITDSIWAYQRDNYGYKNLRSFPLLVDYEGLPYIDVRVSFNSFVPADIPADLANRLVDYYIESLTQSPSLHDKVEFEIVLSCYSFDLKDRLKALHSHGFTETDCQLLTKSLNRLTNRIIHRDTGLWRKDTERIDTLTQRYVTIMNADMDTVSRIYWLLEDCKRYGTLPFAGLARAGFIAVQILRSLVSHGVLSEANRSAFMNGLGTISTAMGHDLASLDREAFLRKYGHLRPGTYDILSLRYDEAPDRYFDWNTPRSAAAASGHKSFALSLDQMRTIGKLLELHNLAHDVVGLFDFLEAGIKGREYSKFVFTRSLSHALSLIGRLGAEHGFSVDDMSYVTIDNIYRLYASSGNVRSVLADAVERGRAQYARTCAVALPPLIISPENVWQFEMPPSEPNFITQLSVSGPVVQVTPDCDLAGKIALIINADPGFDWIFSCDIKGFITAYGGVNSHMAIRAGELNLPAVIGVGEILFAQWSAARMLELDAANRQVRILQ